MYSLSTLQCHVFSAIWATYCITYFLRKPVGIVKSQLGPDFHLSKTELGWLDLSLLLPYAGVQILLSSTWTGVPPSTVISFCLTASAISMVAFSASSGLIQTLACLFVNGAAQALIWPACSKALSQWYPEKRLSLVFGSVQTAPYVGAVMSTTMAVYVQERFGWRFVFVPSAVLGVLVAVLVLVTLRSPDNLKVQVPGQVKQEKNIKGKSATDGKLEQFLKLCSIDAIPEVMIAVFCLKFVRYCLYMWLPLYLMEHLGYSSTEGGIFSMAFDVGGVFGGPILGVMADRFFPKRELYAIALASWIGTVIFCLFSQVTSSGGQEVSILLFLAGAVICGPDSLLTGSVPMTIGERYGVGGGVTSLVNGVGSVGAIIEGPIVGALAHYIGWDDVVHLMAILCALCAVACLRAHRILKEQALLPTEISDQH